MVEQTQWIGGAMQPVPQRVRSAVTPIVESFNCRLVGTELLHEGRRAILWIYIDKDGGATIDDCAKMTPEISAALDVADPVEESYELRVSTPGVDRPLMTGQDFEEFSGQTALIQLATPLGGRRKFTGQLAGMSDDRVRIECTDGEHELPLEYIHRARLKFEMQNSKKRR